VFGIRYHGFTELSPYTNTRWSESTPGYTGIIKTTHTIKVLQYLESNASDVYLGRVRFESRLRHRLSWQGVSIVFLATPTILTGGFHSFPWLLRSNAGVGAWSGARRLHLHPFQTHNTIYDDLKPCSVRQPRYIKKLNSVAWVRERTIPTEEQPIVGDVRANVCV
jgi:hypothetical protein